MRTTETNKMILTPSETAGRTAVEARFWMRVDKQGPDECWPWLGGKSAGYGRLRDGARTRSAHSYSYELANGPVPLGTEVDHTCHNDTDCNGGNECPHRACCNPAHLEAVTHAVNVKRGDLVRTHCKEGHEFTEENTYRTKRKDGSTQRRCRTCALDKQRAYRARL